MYMIKTATALALVIGIAGGASGALAANATKHDGDAAWKKASETCGVAIGAAASGDARDRFRKLDADNNGKLSKQEYMNCYGAEMDRQAKAGASRDDLQKAWNPEIEREVRALDTDKDEQVSEAEFVQAAGKTGSQADAKRSMNDQATPRMSDTDGAALNDDPDHVTARASEYIGKDIVNLNGDEVGEIEDLLVNPGTKKVHALIEVGGFLGIGEKRVVVPLSDLRMSDDDVILMTRQTEEQLETMPAFNDKTWTRIER